MTDLEEAARRTNLVPPGKIASLLADLKVHDFRWLLTTPNQWEQRLQGDIHAEFPVAFVAADGRAVSKFLPVLILNNTCDLQPNRSKTVNVAPVLDFGQFAEREVSSRGERRARSYLHDIRSNRVLELLWLPPFHTFKDGGIVFLDRLSSAAFTIYERSLDTQARLASFSQNGFYYLLIKITSHLARAESSDVQRTGQGPHSSVPRA